MTEAEEVALLTRLTPIIEIEILFHIHRRCQRCNKKLQTGKSWRATATKKL